MTLNLKKSLSPMVNMSCFQTNWDVLIDALVSDNIELVKHIIGDCTHYVDASWPQNVHNRPLYYVKQMLDGRRNILVFQGDGTFRNGLYSLRGCINPLLDKAAQYSSTDTLRWLLGAGFGIEEGPMMADLKVMPMAYKSHDLAIKAVDNALLSAIKGISNGNIEAVQILLEHGVKVTFDTFLSGIHSRNLPLVQLLLRHGGHEFITSGLQEALRTFPSFRTDQREHALSCVSLLLEEGADANALFRNKRTALQLAFGGQSKQHAHSVKLLLDSGANPNEDIRRGKPLGQYALARRFPGYLGVTWDEMVAATEHVRHE